MLPKPSLSLLLAIFSTFVLNGLAASEVSLVERVKLFEKAQKEIEKLQKANPNAKFELNQFAFMTDAEKSRQGLSFATKLPTDLLRAKKAMDFESVEYNLHIDGPIPTSYDYRDHNQITPVKNQSGCGACYVFASTAAVESQYIIHGGQNLSFDLSEEYAMECDTKDGECAGGDEANVYNVYKSSGVPKEECDKYTAQPGACPNTTCQLYKIAGVRKFGADEENYAAYLHKYGPASVSIDASVLHPYESGVLDSNDLCTTIPGLADHVVLLVGYTPDTWIFKNSWGPKWGEDGYFRVKRGMNWCGMAVNEVSVPYIKK